MKTISEKTFYTISQSENRASIYIFGDIVPGTPIVAEIEAIEAEKITVSFNSFGGDPATGMAAYNALKEHPAEVTTINMGFCCSAAAVMFMAGEKRLAHEASDFLFHNAWGGCVGDAEAMENAAEELRTISKSAETAYSSEKLNITQEELDELLIEDRLISSQEAFDMGFVTEIIKDESRQAVAQSVRERILRQVAGPKEQKEEQINQSADTAKIAEMAADIVLQKINPNTTEEKTKQKTFFNFKEEK